MKYTGDNGSKDDDQIRETLKQSVSERFLFNLNGLNKEPAIALICYCDAVMDN